MCETLNIIIYMNNFNCVSEINECLSKPCLHGGRCRDKINHFKCVCGLSGYTGTLCEKSMSDANTDVNYDCFELM